MMRQQIKEAYDRIDPSREEKDKMLLNILSAASGSEPAERNVTMKRFWKKPVMMAATIALMVILMGSAVVALKASDMKMGERSYTEAAHFNEDGEIVPETVVTKDVLSLQGIQGSVNQQAAKEWYDFEESYDPDGTLMAAADQSNFQVPDDYQAYFVYNQEMMDKVDEICEKYGLKLAGKQLLVQYYQDEIFYEALGIGGMFRDEAEVKMGSGAGYFYECGNFNFEFDFALTDSNATWNHEVWASMRYNDKEYFDTVYLAVGDVKEQWNYTCADGTVVLMVNLGDSVRIFCDREDTFISARIETNWYNDDGSVDTMSKADMELVAEALNFGIQPQKPDMASAEKKLAAAEENYQKEQEALVAVSDGNENFASIIANLERDEGDHYFALMDIDGNGTEELFLGDTADSFYEVVTMKGGKTQHSSVNYLCEGGILESSWETDEYAVYGYYQIKSGEDTLLDYVTYDKAADRWANNKYAAATGDPITEAEAKAIIASYIRVELEMKPISEFSGE